MVRAAVVALLLTGSFAEDDVYYHTQLLQTKVNPQKVVVDTTGNVQDDMALFQQSFSKTLHQKSRKAVQTKFFATMKRLKEAGAPTFADGAATATGSSSESGGSSTASTVPTAGSSSGSGGSSTASTVPTAGTSSGSGGSSTASTAPTYGALLQGGAKGGKGGKGGGGGGEAPAPTYADGAATAGSSSESGSAPTYADGAATAGSSSGSTAPTYAGGAATAGTSSGSPTYASTAPTAPTYGALLQGGPKGGKGGKGGGEAATAGSSSGSSSSEAATAGMTSGSSSSRSATTSGYGTSSGSSSSGAATAGMTSGSSSSGTATAGMTSGSSSSEAATAGMTSGSSSSEAATAGMTSGSSSSRTATTSGFGTSSGSSSSRSSTAPTAPTYGALLQGAPTYAGGAATDGTSSYSGSESGSSSSEAATAGMTYGSSSSGSATAGTSSGSSSSSSTAPTAPTYGALLQGGPKGDGKKGGDAAGEGPPPSDQPFGPPPPEAAEQCATYYGEGVDVNKCWSCSMQAFMADDGSGWHPDPNVGMKQMMDLIDGCMGQTNHLTAKCQEYYGEDVGLLDCMFCGMMCECPSPQDCDMDCHQGCMSFDGNEEQEEHHDDEGCGLEECKMFYGDDVSEDMCKECGETCFEEAQATAESEESFFNSMITCSDACMGKKNSISEQCEAGYGSDVDVYACFNCGMMCECDAEQCDHECHGGCMEGGGAATAGTSSWEDWDSSSDWSDSDWNMSSSSSSGNNSSDSSSYSASTAPTYNNMGALLQASHSGKVKNLKFPAAMRLYAKSVQMKFKAKTDTTDLMQTSKHLQ